VSPRKYLTDAEARTMTRRELNTRIFDEMELWKVRRPRTAAQRAAYDKTVQIMHAYIDLHAGLASITALLEGRNDGYWETPVATLPPLAGG